MKLIYFSLIFLVLVFVRALPPRPNLVPYPKEIAFHNETIIVDPCSISYQFFNVYTNEKLLKIPRYYQEILDFFYTRTFPKQQCLPSKNMKNFNNKILQVYVTNLEENRPKYPTKSTNESYELELDETWTLSSENYYGFLRGIETFLQLFEPQDKSQAIFQMSFLPISIRDSPSFNYRGVMIDTARHFISVGTLKHVIEGMLFHKLNVLHWHITDEESFPMESRSFPVLTKYGAYSSDEVYTTENVMEIVEYARMLGVRVIPEVDTPAHSLSWGFSPDLKDIAMRCPIWANYNGQLDPTLDKTYEVVKGVLDDVSEYFPDEFIHLGGDEVGFSCWENNTKIKEFMNQHNLKSGLELQNYYKNREKTLLQPNKSAILWVNDANFDYQPDDILQYWGSSSKYSLIQNYTNRVILSPYDFLYIDVGYGNVFGDQSWAPLSTWKKIHGFNPYPPEIEKSRILGAEVTLWAELNSEWTTDNHLWSRSSVFAERVWNPVDNASIPDVVRRFYSNEQRLIRRGFQPSPMTSQYCGLNVEVCFT